MSQEESLLKRLAGPSSGKAGLSEDQARINRIIADASKGSKFYENEKKKDKELTERINRLLAHLDELLKHADLKKLEASADRHLEELEAQRDLSQYIVHVDMDSFYASVELLDNPTLAGKPFAVGGGVISTASYDARKYGVRSGMAGFVAKKLCPDLIFVKTNFPRYSEFSRQVMDICRQYDQDMAVAGMDEGYMNITAYCEKHQLDPETCVKQIRERVEKETKLTMSAGIAPTKTLAKVCSDRNKPNGQYFLGFERDLVLAFLRDLPIRKIPGIGRVNERLLDSIGIKKCGDIYDHRATLMLLDKQFDVDSMFRTYLGITSNVVAPGQREERKSVGVETTFSAISDPERLLEKLKDIAMDLESDLERTGWAGRTVTLKYKLDTFETFTRAKSMDRWITKEADLFAIGKELLVNEFPLTLRLLGLRVTKLKDLRASEEKGIKRFFQHGDSSPPKKRTKLSGDPNHDTRTGDTETELIDITSEDDMDTITKTEYDEPQGNEIHNSKAIADHPTTPPPKFPERWTRPASARRSAQKAVASSSISPSKPPAQSKLVFPAKSTKLAGPSSSNGPFSRHSGAVRAEPKEKHTCPICSKQMTLTNAELNAHIDFCLSRDVIQQARG
ncbi:IMS-domain-containing protein [Sistotremastrum suecicum HHB10207 ss-3]|uniref:DNA polymerase kappa n=1 Tax=Sistotremastrum suecicum HHB10207 ss-3 TaxID=1314776 RepID=A0A166H9X4_9AGAM|nr:IMS-domain-containing protein [Sistotremastrum suecicum HHB10207 ss-3]